MKVVIKVNRYLPTLHKKGDIKNIEVKDIDFCCDGMKKAWGKFIEFGDYKKSLNINIFNCSPWPEGAVWDEMAIKYCPFCGTEIVVTIT